LYGEYLPGEICTVSLWELGPIIFGPTEDLESLLQYKGLLAASKVCYACSRAMRIRKKAYFSDGITWGYPQCKSTKTIRDGSFFSYR